MQRIIPGLRASKTMMVIAAAALLLALPGLLGAGPDDEKEARAVKIEGTEGAGIPDSNPADNITQWDVFEGHTFAGGRVTPDGFQLLACLGGCDNGSVSEPVTVGADGRYLDLKVGRSSERRDVRADGDVVTFWLAGEDDWVRAHQAVLFLGNSETRKLHLSFANVPVDYASVETEGIAAPAEVPPRWRTTDLTLPSPTDLGLVPNDSAQAFASNAFRYAGLPLLPGFGIVLGVLLTMIGASLLIYRRRISW